jgi:uncharacterized protein (DUF1697 family)
MATRMVALLRGVNVGGNNMVDMARLRALLTALGHTEVRTYLQSGNAVFTCAPAANTGVAASIEDAIAGEFGFGCRVVVRTAAELEAAMAADPLLEVAAAPSRHFVGFLSDLPEAAGVERLTGDDFGDDQLRIIGQHVYLWCPLGISKSPFGKLNFDRILGVAVTMRNWNTVTNLAAHAATAT